MPKEHLRKPFGEEGDYITFLLNYHCLFETLQQHP